MYICGMLALIDKIKRIEIKVKKVLQKVDALKQHNELIELENKKLKQELNQIITDNLASNGAALANVESGSEDKILKVKEELDQYINEIDVCIEKLRN